MGRKPHGRELRKGRFSEPNRIYLITTVTHQRVALFADLICGRLVVQVLQGEQRRAQTLALVVMPDHLHWLMQLGEEADLETVVRNVKSISAHRLNSYLGQRGRVWQSG